MFFYRLKIITRFYNFEKVVKIIQRKFNLDLTKNIN
jgi:hypothetical protein